MKCFLIKGMAAMAIIGAMVSCSNDNDNYQPTKEERLANAEAQLGVKIDPNQSWQMTAKATAKVSVNMSLGETYAVQIYSNDPLIDGVGYVLTKVVVEDGQTVEKAFEYPSALKNLVVSITNAKGFTSYKNVPVVDSLLIVDFRGAPAGARGMTRSQENPSVPHIAIPTKAYAQSFLEGAKEPTDANVTENDANKVTYTITKSPMLPSFNWGQVPNDIKNNNNYQPSQEDRAFYDNVWEPLMAQYDAVQLIYDTYNNPKGYIDSHNQKIDIFLNLYNQLQSTGRSSWMTVNTQPVKGEYTAEGNFVRKFKITGTYNNIIPVLSSEGDLARTLYISGKWTLPANIEQRIGGGAVIVIDNGGELEIPQNGLMTFVNEARLVVMPGGKITGAGKIFVTNGNAEGLEGYNGGTIDIGTFNNNFGKFYNYGSFKANEYQAGSTGSNIYNHGVVYIDHSSIWNNDYYTAEFAPNARIYNACQWYCANDMSCRIIEMTTGAYMYIGRELMVGYSQDNTEEPSYVSLADGALLQAGWLHNNGAIWSGPVSGNAVVEFGKIKFLNWDGNGPLTTGYFINGLLISVDTKDNNCLGHSNQNAYTVFSTVVVNGIGDNGNTAVVGSGGTYMIEKGAADVEIPASEDFIPGVKGCTPGYNGTPGTNNTQPAVWSYAFEDTPMGDYDLNDVVIKVSQNAKDENMLDVTLCCTGASFDLKVWLGNKRILYGKEVHDVLSQPSGSLVNTGKGPWTDPVTLTIEKPDGFEFSSADFWIESPAEPDGVHIVRENGVEPHGVIIPEDWAWPVENVHITEAYPGFARFAENAATEDEDIKQWYKNPVANLVITAIPEH